jgi:hypothetical protein
MHAAVHVAALRRDGQDGAAISQYRRARSAVSASVLQGRAASRCAATSAASHRCRHVPAPAERLKLLQTALRCALSATAQRSSLFPHRCEGYCGTRPPASARLHLPLCRCGYLSPASALLIVAGQRYFIVALPGVRGILRLAAHLCAELLAQPRTTPRPGAPPPAFSYGRPPTPPRVLRASCALCASRASQAPRLRCGTPLLRHRLVCSSAPAAACVGETRALLRQASPPRSWTGHGACSQHRSCCQSCARPLSLLLVTAGAAALLPPSSQREAACPRCSAAKPAPSHLLACAASAHDRPRCVAVG